MAHALILTQRQLMLEITFGLLELSQTLADPTRKLRQLLGSE
jgi:hypothetical protein